MKNNPSSHIVTYVGERTRNEYLAKLKNDLAESFEKKSANKRNNYA